MCTSFLNINSTIINTRALLFFFFKSLHIIVCVCDYVLVLLHSQELAYFCIIGCLGYYFRGHPKGSANKRLSFVH